MKALILLTAAFVLASCKGDSESSANEDSAAPAATNAKGPVVIIETSMGTIEAKLHPGTAPVTTENFLKYVEEGHFDGTIFHRVMSTFMIQGGGFALQDDVPTEKATGDPIKNESPQSEKNLRGTLAMARTNAPDSATAQFFINVVDNKSLDYPNSNGHGYAVFGEVTKGMEVVDQIKEVPVDTSYMNSLEPDGRLRTDPHQNVPLKPVIIKSITVASD